MVSYGEKTLKDAVNQALLGVNRAAARSPASAGSGFGVGGCGQEVGSDFGKSESPSEPTRNGKSYPQVAEIGCESLSEPLSESGTNLCQNRGQIGDKPMSESGTNRGQAIKAKDEPMSESWSEPLSESGTSLSPIYVRIGDRSQNFLSLPPRRSWLLTVLYLNTKINGGRVTQRLSLSYISERAKMSKTSVKTGIRRLKKKGFLVTREYRSGCSGWVSYEIPERVYLEILNLENRGQLWSKPMSESGSEPLSESGTTAPYSSCTSSLNLKETTTTDKSVRGCVGARDRVTWSELPEDWQDISIEPLRQIGFSRQHLQMLHAGGLESPQLVQESINNYAWGLANNAEAYKQYPNLLRPLLGVLKKGKAWTESGYESPSSIALKAVTEAQRKRRRQESELIDELMKIEFPIWRDLVGQDKLDEIAPKGCMGGIATQQTLWKEYFKKHVLLPKLRAEGAVEFYDGAEKSPTQSRSVSSLAIASVALVLLAPLVAFTSVAFRSEARQKLHESPRECLSNAISNRSGHFSGIECRHEDLPSKSILVASNRNFGPFAGTSKVKRESQLSKFQISAHSEARDADHDASGPKYLRVAQPLYHSAVYHQTLSTNQ